MYAKWIPEYTVNYYYVYFKGDNATISQSAAITTTVVSGECANQPSDPEVTGYTFVGWYSDESCTSEYNFSEAVESGIELYAKLTLDTFTVNFYNAYSYDGSEKAVQTLTIYYGDTIAASDVFSYFTETSYAPYYPASNEVTEGSKTFAGWYYYTSENTTANFVFTSENDATTITSDLNIYANWVDVYLTVTLNLNGGTLSATPDGYTNNNDGTYTKTNNVIYGSTLTAFTSDPTKTDSETNYTFTGWYIDEYLTTKFVFGSDESATKVTANIALYAGWDVTEVTINGVKYTKVVYSTNENGATKYFGKYTEGDTSYNAITVDNVTSYWVVSGYTNLSAYYGDTWLILENEINGYPVLEIGAGALANTNGDNASTSNSLTNVLVPENIVMVGSRAFLDNKGITSIVFLADEVYFSYNSKESTANTVSSDYYYNGVTSGGENSKNFPFYGCGIDKYNKSTYLTVYYRTAYSTGCTVSTSGETKTITLDGGVFVIGKDGSTYTRTNNDTSTSSNSSLKTITWLYVNTSSIAQALTCGNYERGDFDWASAIVDAFSGCGVACCSYNGHVFVGGSLGDCSAFAANIKTIINSFTAEYGEYINGYEVSAAAGTSLVNGNDVTFTVNTETTETTPYYLLNVSQSVTNGTTAISSAEWTIVSGSNSDSNNTATVTYSAKIGENSTAVTVTVTYSGSVQYFDYSNSSYSTYYSTSDSGAGVYGTGSVTISGTSGYNYKLYNVGDTELTENVTSATVTANSDKVTDVALVWEQTDDPYIYIISGVEFTYCDGTNTTTIYENEDGTSGSPLRYNSVKSGSNTDDDDNKILYTATATTDSKAGVATSESNYYFLGWAYMAGADEDGNGGTLTFTNIAADTNTFNSSSVYYAVWAYADFSGYKTTDSLSLSVDATSEGISPATPTIVNSSTTVGTFVAWYTDKYFTTSADGLTTNTVTYDEVTTTTPCLIYYAKTAESTVTINGVTYEFTKLTDSTAVTYTNTNHASDGITDTCSITVTAGGYYEITAYDGSYTNSWLVLENTIDDYNKYPVIAIKADVFNGDGNHGFNSSDSKIENIVVPKNIIYIGLKCFAVHASLKRVIFLAGSIYLDNGSGNGSNYYPFYGDNTSTTTAYYKKCYSMGESSMENDTTGFRVTNSDSKILFTTDWMYIDTDIGTTDVAETTFDLDDALRTALYGCDVTYYLTSDNHLFIAASFDSISNTVKTSITDAIDAFSAEHGSYINGHTVSVTEDTKTVDGTTVSLYDMTVNVSDATAAYYAISEENLLGSTTEGVTTYSNWSTSTISYSEVTTSENTDSVTVTYTLSDGTTLYATYSAAADNFEIYNSVLYIKDCTALTVTANNSTYKLDGIAYGDTADTTNSAASGQSYSANTAASAGTLTLSWSKIVIVYPVTIYTDVAFTLGSTSIAEGTTTVELGSDSATLDGLAVSGAPDYYYFLGWAYDKEGALTFTSGITTNKDTIYYAIWGYNSVTSLSGTHSSSDNDTTSFPAVTGKDVTLYGWYTSYSTITYGNYTYESFDDDSYVEALSGSQTVYYARMSYTLTISFTGNSSSSTTFNNETALKSDTTLSYTTDNDNNNYTYKAYLSGILQGYCLEVVVGRYNRDYAASRPKFYIYTDYATYAGNNTDGSNSRKNYYNYVNIQGKYGSSAYRQLLDNTTETIGFDYSCGSVPDVDYTYVMATSVNCSMSLTSTY